MNKQPVSGGRLAAMAVFVLSCFGITLFLWLNFGGSIPLAPKGYRVTVLVPDGTGLATTADVRVSGVPVGKIVALADGERTSKVTLQFRARYAPIPKDVRFSVRRKTLLGEAYIEMTPGSSKAGKVADGATVPETQVQTSVPIDEVLSTFDKRTRVEMKAWLQGWGAGLDGRGRDLNTDFGHLAATVDAGDGLLSILDRQRGALRRLSRDGGTTFAAIGARDAQIQDLITAGDAVLRTTAARNRELTATFNNLPPFLHELQGSLAATRRLAGPGTPALTALEPAAHTLPQTLRDAVAVAPQLQTLGKRLGPAVTAAPAGLKAARQTVAEAGPLMSPLRTLARALVPATDLVNTYRQEVANGFPKAAAATQPRYYNPGTDSMIHYLRAPVVLSIEGLLGATQRQPYSRNNAYSAPGVFGEEMQAQALRSMDCRNTKNTLSIPPVPPGLAPPCLEQAPFEFRGKTGHYPQLVPAP